ncbi:MAG: hypothetical protein AB7H66_03255 [Hyphomonadaceae bacterium]
MSIARELARERAEELAAERAELAQDLASERAELDSDPDDPRFADLFADLHEMARDGESGEFAADCIADKADAEGGHGGMLLSAWRKYWGAVQTAETLVAINAFKRDKGFSE